ncbi:hypothetical protein CXB51_027796 [Gossypium anomalum]|uniref:Protein kinase domain-containing protein n=1 Tax=Gossypium anomalum TaxID=47600 RepID=A0A8J6CP29_9ROSI|nr:hypothetical protein CXB51_027796 [Gossypium anomalum]
MKSSSFEGFHSRFRLLSAQSGGSTPRRSTSSAIASLAKLPPSSKYSRLPNNIKPLQGADVVSFSMSLSHFYQVSKKAFGFVSRRGSQPNSTLPEELCIRQFSLAEIKAATANFDEGFIIGISIFGSVYKGVIDDGTFTVAIRRMKFSLSAFRTEVVFLSQLNHLNVESLIGFCNEKGETILVYEYLSNGSLFDCLHGNDIGNQDNNDTQSNIFIRNVRNLEVTFSFQQRLPFLIFGFAFPGYTQTDFISGYDFTLANINIGFVVDLFDLLGLDAKIALAVKDGEIRKRFGEERFRPGEAISFSPVPVVDVSTVGSFLHDPALVAFAPPMAWFNVGQCTFEGITLNHYTRSRCCKEKPSDDIDFNQISSNLVNHHPQFSTTIIEVSSMSLSHFFQVPKKAFGFVSQPKFTLPEELCIRQFSLAEIKSATANFDEGLILGISNFGSVYKGVIYNGTFTVAIRRMKFSLSAFRTEVVFLSQLNLLNVESLIGFCNEKGETILVYEYLSNGSLFDCLNGNGISCNPIPWEKRLQICIGAARGLHYLHTGAKYTVLHRNVSSNTILLDQELVPKLSGLGSHSMSKASIKKESLDVVATFGYLDLENLSGKNDVYAFGVVLLEVICGKISLPACANWCIENGTIYHNIDPYLKGRIAPECFNKYVEIAMSCISYSADERPSMGEVEATLLDALELEKKADSEMKSIIPHSEVMTFVYLLRNGTWDYVHGYA